MSDEERDGQEEVEEKPEAFQLPIRRDDETDEEQQIRLSARLEFAGTYAEEVQKITERLVPEDYHLEHCASIFMALCAEMCFWQSMFLAEGGTPKEMNALLLFAKKKGQDHFTSFLQGMEGEIKVQELRNTIQRN